MQFKDILITSIILLTFDYLYLNYNKSFFSRFFQNIQGSELQFNLYPAIICYLLIILGLNYFIIKENRPILDAFLLGVLIYGVYDTTNHATLSKWTLQMTITDSLWGGSLFAITTFIVYKLREMI